MSMYENYEEFFNVQDVEEPQYVVATSAMRTADMIAGRNSVPVTQVVDANPDLQFPVEPGTRVRLNA